MLKQKYPLAEAWLWHRLCVYATGDVAMTPFPSQLGRRCHGLNFLTSPGPPCTSSSSSPHFHSVVTLSAKGKISPHPKTSRKRSCPCSARFELQFWLQSCIPSHLHAGCARGEPRHTVSHMILLMGYLKQTLIALKSRQLSAAASG